jgi:phage terminase small subunit
MTYTKNNPEIQKCIDEETNTFYEEDMPETKEKAYKLINDAQKRCTDAVSNTKDKALINELIEKYFDQEKKLIEQVVLAEKEGKQYIEEHCTKNYKPKGGKRRTRKSGKKARRSKKNNKKRKGKKSKRIRKRK